jgi:predicted metal-dependent peptidase
MSDPSATARHMLTVALDYIYTHHPILEASIAARMRAAETTRCKFMATDGKTLHYNPGELVNLTQAEVTGIYLHEIHHVLNGHQWRREHRDRSLFNIASDLAINSHLLPVYQRLGAESLIEKGCFPRSGKFAAYPEGKSAEYYYMLLEQDGLEAEDEDGEDEEGETGDDSNSQPGDGEGNESDGEEAGEAGEGSDGESGESSGDAEGDGGQPGEADGQSGDGVDGEGSGNAGEGEGDAGEGEGDGDGSEGAVSGKGKGKGNGSGQAPGADEKAQYPNWGEILDAPEASEEETDKQLSKDEFTRELTMAVMEAKAQGSCPGYIQDIVDALLDGRPSRTNYRPILQSFFRKYAPGLSDFSRINRRSAYRSDIILPDTYSRCGGRGLLVVDTSGSMGKAECDCALHEISRILVSFPRAVVDMIQCDTRLVVQDGKPVMKSFTRHDFPLKVPVSWQGRGGTDLDPAFDYARDNRNLYNWMAVVTDFAWGYGAIKNPGVPTIWIGAAVNDYRADYYTRTLERLPVPFGKAIVAWGGLD